MAIDTAGHREARRLRPLGRAFRAQRVAGGDVLESGDDGVVEGSVDGRLYVGTDFGNAADAFGLPPIFDPLL